jgi:hypothetical protein
VALRVKAYALAEALLLQADSRPFVQLLTKAPTLLLL